MNPAANRPILVVGAGIAGVTAALEAAEAGLEVVLIESEPAIGGRVLKNHAYFPKQCPPSCGMEINTRRLENNPRIRILLSTQASQAQKTPGGWMVTLETAAAIVNDKCTACGDCAAVCKTMVPDPFNLGLAQVKAARLVHGDAWPRRYIIEASSCPAAELEAMAQACKVGAIDLAAKSTQQVLEVSAVVVATGWQPYPIEQLDDLGGGILPDVIANVHLERLVAASGPSQGKILRPSDGQAPKRVAFVQCAGSRDVNHLPYCSAVCCLASLKQAQYVSEQLPEAEITIYYIDRRAPGRNEDVLTKVSAMDKVTLIKGKVGKISQLGPELCLRVEDTETGKLLDARADLVVLATGMVPRTEDLPFGLLKDADGFGLDAFEKGLFVAGVSRRPEDVAASVRDATGAAAKASVYAMRRA